MLATLLSATLAGITGRVVRVEVDVAPGLPGFTIVGLPDAALSEARERVRGALRNAGFHHPPRRITVNLAPAELRKAGASLDLAIAMGILLGSEQLRATPGRLALIGELGLGGEVRRVPGILPMCLALARRGVTRVIVPEEALGEARLASGIDAVPAATVAEAAEVLRSARTRRIGTGVRIKPRGRRLSTATIARWGTNSKPWPRHDPGWFVSRKRGPLRASTSSGCSKSAPGPNARGKSVRPCW